MKKRAGLRWLITALLGLLVISLLTAALLVCRGGRVAVRTAGCAPAGGSTNIKALDAPGNPYAGKYGPWDEWILAHAGAQEWNGNSGPRPSDWHTLDAYITAEGWLVPAMVVRKKLEDHFGDPGYRITAEFPGYMPAPGHLPWAKYKEFLEAQFNVSRGYYPDVPAWLAADPPRGAMLYPNGDVITIGMLGSGDDAVRGSSLHRAGGGCTTGADDGWPVCRYNSEGELVCTTHYSWLDLYIEEMGGKRPEGRLKQRDDWYFTFTDDNGAVLGVYDFDGKKLAGLSAPPRRANLHPFIQLTPTQVRLLFNAQ